MGNSSAVNRFSKGHSQDWRKRATGHCANIAALLIERAQQGMCVQGSFLYAHPELYGRSPRNRISELNRRGWDIGSKPGEHGCSCYWVRHDDTGRGYPTARFDEPETSPRPRLVAQPEPKAPLLLFDVSPRP